MRQRRPANPIVVLAGLPVFLGSVVHAEVQILRSTTVMTRPSATRPAMTTRPSATLPAQSGRMISGDRLESLRPAPVLDPILAAQAMQAADRSASPVGRPSVARPTTVPPGAGLNRPVTWTTGLQAGLEQAGKTSKPVLVRVGAEWCGWCRKLDAEIRNPAVQNELARWTPVYIDADRARGELDTLSIGPIPALRVLTPGGRVVAGQDGYLSADALVRWLKAQYDQAAVMAPIELQSDQPPTPELLVKLIAQFENRDPVLREAAIRRLAGHPDLAAGAVTKAFATGRLSARLASLELLESWKAPVRGMDPWRPETITPQRLEALRQWSAAPGKPAASRPTELEGAALAAARGELADYLKAGSPADVQAIRERLARHGLALLPEVLDRLKTAETGEARERLGALRYRLAAGDALALRWPGGFERLASTSAVVCQQAADELTRLVRSDDAPLLLELFGHPDPLVRETALRTLQAVGGAQATDALVRLLHDPEPNVRAAVLKQLAEKPNPQLVPRIARYLEQEPDADLVVHAVRFLRAAKGPDAVACMIRLLAHESWRVRAEAAEAVGECATDSRAVPEQQRTEALAALINLLDDPDGFVVSRAVLALKNSYMPVPSEPLTRAAARHPELAAEVSEILAGRYRGQNATNAVQLKKFTEHADPTLRAAGIQGLVSIQAPEMGSALVAGLQDPAESVRIASASAMMEALESLRLAEELQSQTMVVERPAGLLGALFGGRRSARVVATRPAGTQPSEAPGEPPDRVAAWLVAFREGRNRPDWVNQTAPALLNMLSSASLEERVSAAGPLIALGHDAVALSVLLAESLDSPAIQSKAAAALPWLAWEQRIETYHQLMGLSATPEHRVALARELLKVADLRAGPPVWDLLARPDFSENGAPEVYEALLGLYFGRMSYNPESVPAARRRVAAEQSSFYAENGSSWQRIIGLAVLVAADRSAAGELAGRLLQDPSTAVDSRLRQDLARVYLISQPYRKANELAVKALSGDNPALRQTALYYLALGRSHVHVLRDRIPLRVSYTDPTEFEGAAFDRAIQPKPPPGLRREDVAPLLADADPSTAAAAGYLTALLGGAEGLKPLVEYWRSQAGGDERWSRLVYRAIVALNDDAQTPLLEEIYAGLAGHEYQLREFYWTLRSMKGEKVLKLREEVRVELNRPRALPSSPSPYPVK